MKRVAISQRLDAVRGRNEVRDCLDARFGELLWSLGLLPIPVSNRVGDPERYIEMLQPEAFLLTGGSDLGKAPERDAMECAMLQYAQKRQTPVLGVCRGMQVINCHQGGQLETVAGHVNSTHQVKGPLVPGGRIVNSYHNHAVTGGKLGASLEPLAYSPDDTIEALRHTKLPWLAIMWHPERNEEWDSMDLELIVNHLGASQ